MESIVCVCYCRQLLPVAAVPVIASGAMVPATRCPGSSGPCPAPVTVVPVIAAAAADPVTVEPDITVARRHRPGIYNIGRLVADIAVDCTAGCGETAR